MQATAAPPGSPATPRVAAGEVTEAALAARQEQGVASFAEFYAAVLLGILVEQDAPLRQARARGRLREFSPASNNFPISYALSLQCAHQRQPP